VNRWRLSEALTSVRRLAAVLKDMTDEELVAAIQLEQTAGRRKSILLKLERQRRVLALNAVATKEM